MLVVDMSIILYYQGKIDEHGKAMSIVHHNHVSIDHLSSTAHKIFRQNEFDIKDELLLTKTQVTQNIDLLIQGGKVPGTSLTISSMEEDVLSKAKNLKKNWVQATAILSTIHTTEVKVDSIIKEQVIKSALIDSTYQDISEEIDRVVRVPNPKIKNALTQFSSYKKLLFEDLKGLNEAIISDFENQKGQYDLVLWAMLLLNLGVIGFFLFLMIIVVIRPLGKIGELSRKVANGEDIDIRYKQDDELGEIVSSVKALGYHLRQASNFVHHIGEGNLEVTLEGLEKEKDTQGSLANTLIGMQNKLKLVSQEDQERNWATIGLANFAEILRNNNNDIQSLGDDILAEIISYTDANIGCIYVPNQGNESTELQLIAFYAYDTKKHFSETIVVGDGLVGQTFVEKKTTYLLEIPDNYTNIKSGVGSSVPRSILVIPLKVNEDIYGVLELASFKEFSKEQIQFIEKIAETIASTIHNVKNAEQTKQLLEDSQQLTEQMRAQEEEMRQNMEELSATQEEIARKELHTASTIEAFNNSVASIELNQTGVIDSVNTVFTKFSGISKDKLNGQHLSSILASIDGESLEDLIESIFKNQQPFTRDLLLSDGSAKKSKIKGYFSYLQSGNAILICSLLNDSSTLAQPPMSELQQELTQNLNMLELTQQSLNEKSRLMEESFVYVEIDREDQVVMFNNNLLEVLEKSEVAVKGKKYSAVIPLSDIDKTLILSETRNNGTYLGVITLDNAGIGDRKILLHIERLNDKK
jgi:GAF domain-containing protein/HAMP domain-containing protein